MRAAEVEGRMLRRNTMRTYINSRPTGRYLLPVRIVRLLQCLSWGDIWPRIVNSTLEATLPREAEIAGEIKLLISKVVRGEASEQDRSRLTELSELRSQLMRPAAIERFVERRKITA